MKKILILFLTIPLLAFSQPKKQKKNEGTKKAFVEKQIIDSWKEYSKAFEYSDYNKVASHFTYPTTFSLLENPQIINNKKELISAYKKTRTDIQDGYKYSLLDKSRIIWLSKGVFMIDATYSRYNEDYKRIYQGRGVYMYKKVDDNWKMFSVSSLPMQKKKIPKANN
jgi:hypothetical protein